MLFLGLEGSKQPQEFGANAHFGGRFSATSLFGLVPAVLAGVVGKDALTRAAQG